jgi:hypothetical protein
MAITIEAREAMLDGMFTFLETGSGTASLTLYHTNTSLAVFPLAGLSVATGDALVLTGTGAVDSTGTEVAGTANRFVIANANGQAAHSGSVGAIGSGADIETPTLTVTAAATQSLNALVLRMDAYGNLSTEASLFLQ